MQDPTREKMMEKVRKLIALSESSNVHEAEVAAAAAQRLMLEYKIAVSEISQDTAEEDIVMDVEIFRDLDMKAPPRWHGLLLSAVASANFCMVVLSKDYDHMMTVMTGRLYTARVYHLLGTEADRATTVYVYQMLRNEIEQLCEREARLLRFNRGDRAAFKLGAAHAIGTRIRNESRDFCRQAKERNDSQALAVLDKTARALDQLRQRRYPELRSGPAIRTRNMAAFEQGRAAGARVEMSRPTSALNAPQLALPG